MYTLLETVRKHLNLDDTFRDDDKYLINLIDVAETVVENHIDRPFAELVEKNNGLLPANLRHAILLLVGDYYANRESVSFGTPHQIPHTVDFLLNQTKYYSIP